MRQYTPIKTKVMTMIHGRSEYHICKSIQSLLKIKQEIIARDKGKSSIQINGIMDILMKDSRFKSFHSFIRSFPDIEHNKSILLGFNLFIIMDVDDCTSEMKRRFLNKELFKKHWLYDYIIPIFNDPNLEKTMTQSGIPIHKKRDYVDVFSTNRDKVNIEVIKDLMLSLENCSCTNLDVYVSYCLSIITLKDL